MNEEDLRQNERQSLLTRLLDAVKQCQVRFGGRSELATDSDSRVSCLCATWEAALQHGMKKNNKALSTFRHMTERAGLGKMSDFFSEVKHLDTEPAFWQYVKEHLTKHEVQRFNTLKQINTDMGRGRAWLRACLNEHSLERYMHMLIEKEDLISQYYHDWAFMCDQERNSMLPTMSAGLGSILFAITVDRPELNKAYQNTQHVGNGGDVILPTTADDEPRAVIADSSSPNVKKKEKKKKKKTANVVSFDEQDNSEPKSRRHSSATSASSSNATDDRNSDIQYNAFDSSCTSACESPVFVQKSEFKEKNSVQRASGSDSSMDKIRLVLQPQSSVTSTTSVFSATSDVVSKSSTGSTSSLDGDLGHCILTPVENTELHDDDVPVSQAATFSLDGIHSDASSDLSVFSRGDVDTAALALAVVQKGFESGRTEGDGGISEMLSEQSHQYMSHEELRQAVVAMMVRKDEVEEQKRSLQALLEQEMDMTSMLRADIAELKQSYLQQQEADQAKISKLQSENELLKHQLKKYVNAVQLLRVEGATNKDDGLGIRLDDAQPTIPPQKPAIDYSHEASEYEQKLIQVAEMHGELMEFNELLHRQINAKDAVLRKLRHELVMLRGPLPYNENQLEESATSALESLSIHGRTLINIWIPSAFLRGSSSDRYHVYQVYIRIKDEEWNVFRRYSQFLDLHVRLKKVYPIVGKFGFPPKKSMGSKEAKVVENRRQVFQNYLRQVINVLQDKNPQLCSDTCKSRLVSLLPFFQQGDQPEGTSKKGKKRQQQHLQPPPPQAASSSSPPQSAATGSGYQGL